MKNLLTTLLILFSITTYSQNLIGMSSKEIVELGINKYDDSTYISIDSTSQINVWVKNDTVILEQYVIMGQKDTEELYEMLEESFILVEVVGKDLYFESRKTGVTCMVRGNIFTLYYRRQ